MLLYIIHLFLFNNPNKIFIYICNFIQYIFTYSINELQSLLFLNNFYNKNITIKNLKHK
jgi:hypothetical protein